MEHLGNFGLSTFVLDFMLLCHFHVNSPLRTSDACVTALETLQSSCCTKCHDSAVLRLLAFSIASAIPGKCVDP